MAELAAPCIGGHGMDASDSTASSRSANIHAVVVAYRRYDRLATAFRSLERQQPPVARVILVDNTPPAERRRVETTLPVRRLPNERNLNGAGGYAMGILAALGAGADHILLLDDDGQLVGADYIRDALAELSATGADLVAPLPVDEEDSDQLCFPYPVAGGRTYDVAEMERVGRVEGFGHLFNGCVVPAATFLRFGLPDIRLCLRGDEVDFLHRMLRNGGRVVTSARIKVAHPSGKPETHSVLWDSLMAIDPGTEAKRYLTFRNRGYIFWHHRRYVTLAADIVRYFLYFVVLKRDWKAYRNWVRLTIEGARSRLGPPESAV
ncbi:MAG: glycosyltransferase [Rhizobiaceae bacterium]|nr:glycosyltransferase [Rhizobiaceae bacterium]